MFSLKSEKNVKYVFSNIGYTLGFAALSSYHFSCAKYYSVLLPRDDSSVVYAMAICLCPILCLSVQQRSVYYQ